MVRSLLRSKLSVLGKIPESDILNKFTNDSSILDYQAPNAAIYLVEHFFSISALLVSVSQLNIYFIIPAIVCLLICSIFFRNISEYVATSKLLDL